MLKSALNFIQKVEDAILKYGNCLSFMIPFNHGILQLLIKRYKTNLIHVQCLCQENKKNALIPVVEFQNSSFYKCVQQYPCVYNGLSMHL